MAVYGCVLSLRMFLRRVERGGKSPFISLLRAALLH